MNSIFYKRFFSILFFLSFYFATAQNPYFDISKQMEIYNDMLKKLSTNYIDEINFGDLIQKTNRKMLNGLDRFTTYYDEQGILDQKMRQEGHFGGMGISMQIKDSAILITRIYKNTPAANEGLQVGDQIIEIENKKVSDMNRKVASSILKGEKGSKIALVIKRNGKIINKKITRDDIPLNAVTSTKLVGDIGYIRFVKFNQKASSQTKMALLDLKKQGAKKIIIDVRGNPGGLLNEVVKIVNFFVPKGKVVVTTKGRFKKYDKTYLTKNESIDEEIPIVILVNNHSASASEILSGSLQDYDRAVIIGDTTYGKGLVQRTFKLKYGTYMKQTISKYFIPSGRLIQKIDYWHRDKNGKPLLMSENLPEKNYQTAHGRTVHNLGGVIPDIVMEDEINNPLIRDLLKKNVLFDFATWYYYNKEKPSYASAFSLNDKDFESFLNYLKQHDIHPQTHTEKTIKKAYEKALKEKQRKTITDSYKKLLEAYAQENLKTIQAHKDQILDLIARDLVYRYFYIDGYTEYTLQKDQMILEAKKVLNDSARYHTILHN